MWQSPNDYHVGALAVNIINGSAEDISSIKKKLQCIFQNAASLLLK